MEYSSYTFFPPKLFIIPENIGNEGSLPSVCLHSLEAKRRILMDYMEINTSLEL